MRILTTTTAACLAAFSISTAALSATNVTTAATEPAGFVEDKGAADRIEVGDRMRTLTQAMASAACHLNAGVDVKASKSILSKGMVEFDRLSLALLEGSVDLHILEPETNPKTRRALAKLETEWQPIRAAFDAILANNTDTAALETVYANTDDFLKWSSILLAQLEGQYSNPTELLQSDMLLMEVAGKQAMVAQRLSYEACKIWSGSGTEEDVADLKELIVQFEFAVLALKEGRPELGIQAAPSEKIAKKLDKVIGDWDTISWKLTSLADSGTITHEEAVKMCRVLFRKMASMEKVTHMYTEYSRRVY